MWSATSHLPPSEFKKHEGLILIIFKITNSASSLPARPPYLPTTTSVILRLMDSENLGLGPSTLCFNRPSRKFWCIPAFEDHQWRVETFWRLSDFWTPPFLLVVFIDMIIFWEWDGLRLKCHSLWGNSLLHSSFPEMKKDLLWRIILNPSSLQSRVFQEFLTQCTVFKFFCYFPRCVISNQNNV